MTRRPELLWAVAAVALTVGVVTLAWPVDGRPAPVVPALTAPGDAPAFPAAEADLAERMVAHNAFDPSRRPPSSRELLATADTFPEPLAIGEGDSVASTADAGFSAEPVPALFGIVDTPDGRRALLRLDPDKARAALFGPGDGTAGWRVVQIGPEAVTLDGPNGRQVVTLAARPRTP